MKQPAGATSYDIVRACLERLGAHCRENGIKKVALPALGTGVGRLDKARVARLFREVLAPVEDVEFVVVDIDESFIQMVDSY